MKIKKTTQWQWLAIRQMCIQHNLYTCGDNDAYNKLYTFTESHTPTTKNIYLAAKDIVKHSDLSRYNQTEKENIESIMFELENTCVRTFYEIEE